MDYKKLDQFLRQQIHHCQELMKEEKTPDEFMVKALRSLRTAVPLLQRYTDSEDGSKDENDLTLAMHKCTQSLLDSTYSQECQLINTQFKDSSSFNQITSINLALSQPAQLCGGVESVGGVLGVELLECLYWRVGALLYMFCHSLYEEGGEEGRRQMDKKLFLKCCCAGVGYLRLMLSARTPLGKDEDYVSHDADMVQLLQQGIFSDIHMLSLMYAGELCYWAWAISLDSQPSSTTSTQDNTKGTHAADCKEERSVTLEGSNRTEDSNSGTDTSCTLLHSTAGSDDYTKVKYKSSDTASASENPPTNTGSEASESAKLGCVSIAIATNTGGGSLKKLCESKEQEMSNSGEGDNVSEQNDDRRDSSSSVARDCVAKEDVGLYHVMLHTRGQGLVDSWKAEFSALVHGVEMLTKYVDVARGPLKGQGWNYSKAVELIVKLKKARLVQRNN